MAVLRDPGFNVASWNISRRPVSIGHDGVIRAAGEPLRFWHFTKLGQISETMTRRYARENFEVYEIWNWYRRRREDCRADGLPAGWWAHGVYADGSPIPKAHRRAYRDSPALQAAYGEPFASGEGSLQAHFAEAAAVVQNP